MIFRNRILSIVGVRLKADWRVWHCFIFWRIPEISFLRIVHTFRLRCLLEMVNGEIAIQGVSSTEANGSISNKDFLFRAILVHELKQYPKRVIVGVLSVRSKNVKARRSHQTH